MTKESWEASGGCEGVAWSRGEKFSLIVKLSKGRRDECGGKKVPGLWPLSYSVANFE